MLNATTIALHSVALISGSVFLYAALFLYEDEQGKVQNKLEDLWIKIDVRHHVALSKHTVFMRVVADYTARTLSKLFGEKFFSLRFLGVSICFSLASYYLLHVWT